jgi:GNAT superfamily N-acetyltransferase
METEQNAAGRESGQLRVRPLRQDDARGVATLIASLSEELGTRMGMSVEQTEQLFTTPWLEGGAGFVLEHGSELAGYGFARPTRWKGADSVQLGLTIRHGYRERESYHILTDRLIEAAMDIARRHDITNVSVHLRSSDTVHPPLMIELGFREHPVSMLGFRHDLADIAPRCLPEGFSFRPARLPEETSAVMDLMGTAFDDRDRQGEPIGSSYLDFISGKSGFDPEQVLLVEDSGARIGCVIIDAAARGAGSCRILELGVLPVSRRRGIGSALVCRALEWTKARGAGTVLTGMFSTNLAATLFWRLGFRPDSQHTFRFFVRDAAPPPADD